MNEQVHICTGCKIFLSVFIIPSNMTSILAIGTNHAKILTSVKDSRLRNKLDKSKAKKWTTMSQVLQDVADMAVDFDKVTCGYSLPTFKVQYVSSANSSSSFRSNRLTIKNTQQLSAQTGKAQALALPRRTLQKGLSNNPQAELSHKVQIHQRKTT